MTERRAAPRLHMLIELYGRTVPLGTPITLLNISRTGMAVRTELPLPAGMHHTFELILPDESAVVLAGGIVHRAPADDDAFTVGVRFTDAASVAAAFDRIIACGIGTPDKASSTGA